MKKKSEVRNSRRVGKVVFITALLAAVCTLAGCGAGASEHSASEESDSQNAAPERLQVVATIFPPYDFVREVGGDYVDVSLLLKPGMEAHSYEPTPRDIIRITESDLFLYAGGESDVWVEKILDGTDREVNARSLFDWVEPLEEETREGMQTREHGHDHDKKPEEAAHGEEAGEGVRLEGKEYDEHVWTSPQNAILLVERIREELSALDPAHSDIYAENAGAYTAELEQLDQDYRLAVEQGKRKLLVFGDRFPFLYLVKTYGLDYAAAFPGCSLETEPSAAMIAYLTNTVKEEGIPVILYLELSNHKIADAIAEATGAKTGMLHSCHTLTREEKEAGETYLSLMRRNLEVLKEALR